MQREHIHKMLWERGTKRNPLHGDTHRLLKHLTKRHPDLYPSIADGTFRWTPPTKRVIGSREVSIYCDRDRALARAILFILSSYYEPQFSRHSHGFRRWKGQKSAITELRQWYPVRWIVHYDVAHCFTSINATKVVISLGEQITDYRLLDLLLHHYRHYGLDVGSPLSPILCNIYLNDLDWSQEIGYYYLRYADNIILTGPDCDRLPLAVETLQRLVAGLGLTVREKTASRFLGVDLEIDHKSERIIPLRPATFRLEMIDYYTSLEI